MAIIATDIILQLTGGAGNSDPNASLGGVNSGNTFGQNLHDLFDVTSAQEATDGDVEYRAIDVKNNHATETLYNAVIWISADGTTVNDTPAMALDATTQSVANEDTAPSAPTLSFSTPTTKATGLTIGNMAALSTQRVWIRWTVTAGATAANTTFTIKVEGDTGP